MMQIFFLAIFIWAVQLKALPSNISHGHADGELTQYSELAARAPGFKYPFKSRQPYLEMTEAKSVCEPDSGFWSENEFPPLVKDCQVLRDQIAARPGVWFITTGEWDHEAWQGTLTRIAKYETCEIKLFVYEEKGFFFGSGDALSLLDVAVANGGVGTKMKPSCDERRDIRTFVYHKRWPLFRPAPPEE